MFHVYDNNIKCLLFISHRRTSSLSEITSKNVILAMFFNSWLRSNTQNDICVILSQVLHLLPESFQGTYGILPQLGYDHILTTTSLRPPPDSLFTYQHTSRRYRTLKTGSVIKHCSQNYCIQVSFHWKINNCYLLYKPQSEALSSTHKILIDTKMNLHMKDFRASCNCSTTSRYFLLSQVWKCSFIATAVLAVSFTTINI
jgi:hypothetical protein